VFAAEPLDRGEVHLDAVARLQLGEAALAEALGGGPMIAVALDFWTWRRLAAEGLSDATAAALMARAARIS
jgi:hypothetical protein